MSVIALFVLAAEEAEHTPIAFYIGGGVLAAWAVLLSAVGMMRPDFPKSEGTTKGLYGVSALLVLATAASAILSG